MSLIPPRIALRDALRAVLNVDGAKSALFYYVLATYVLRAYRTLLAQGVTETVVKAWRWVSLKVVLLALRLPSARARVETEINRAKQDIAKRLVPQGPNVIRHLAVPREGKSVEWISAEMERMDKESPQTDSWKDGKISGAVYHGGDDIEKVISAAVQKYCVSNPLHPDVFPSIRKMEAEIVAMCLRMYNHPNGCGVTTSGGTESILMSCKAHRDWAKEIKGITEPEIIMPTSGHAAFDKAGHYFGIRIVHVPVNPTTRQVEVSRVRRAINPNTIMIVGSAVNFPDGAMDDIPALSLLATRYGIGLHVDCCLGSFIVPFLGQAGFPTRLFDFRLPGVTAISCDTHKYGFAPKGSSVIMYRNSELRQHQYFIYPDWAGGVYASPSMAGSRPGSLIAGTWAAMHYMGESGYIESCRQIVGAAKRIATAIKDEFPDLYVLGNPLASVVAFASKSPRLNVHEVGDSMSKRGWHLNAVCNPPGVHIACTRLTLPMVDQFIADLKDSVEAAKTSPPGKGHMVTVYGLGSSSVVGPTMIKRMATEFINALYIA